MARKVVGRRQRRHARLDRAARSAATTTTRCSCRSRRRRPRCSSPSSARARIANQGQRVVDGQRLMQAASDIFLGWERVTGHRRRAARLLRPPAPGLEGLGPTRDHGPAGDGRLRRGSAPGRSPAPTPARATGSRSPPTSGKGDAFDRAIADVRRGLRRPERARLRGARGRGRERTDRGEDGDLSGRDPPVGRANGHRRASATGARRVRASETATQADEPRAARAAVA